VQVIDRLKLRLLDGMIWIRGSSDDYDKWAEITGDEGWSWKQIIPYFKKVSIVEPPYD
jgi:choline dehydrogenase-like flavoprotein